MKETNKFIFTFGEGQLQQVKGVIKPMNIMLVIEAENEGLARKEVFASFVGEGFFTSYPHEPYAQEFKDNYGMSEVTLKELENLQQKRSKNVTKI